MRRRASQVTEILFVETEISATGLKMFPYEHFRGLPGRKVFDKLASLSQQGGQNGVTLLCMHFHVKSIRISFITKVTRVNKAMIVANDTSLCCVILALFPEFHFGRPG